MSLIDFVARYSPIAVMILIAAVSYYLLLGVYAKHCKPGSALAKVLKHLFLFILGGSIYYSIEILWRGHSHFSMFLVGGLCFVIMGLANEIFSWDLYFEYQLLIGWCAVLILEFVSGCIINLWLGWGVWDYSGMPFNLLGQICLTYAFLWIPIVILGILIDDWVRYKLLNEEKPRYRSLIVDSIKYLINKIKNK